MAPKRYGYSGSHYNSGGTGSGQCDFVTFRRAYLIGKSIRLPNYVNDVLFLILTIALASSFFFLRKKLTQKKLTGPLLWASLFFQILGWVLTVLAVTLLQCSVIGRDYYNFQLAFNLFFNLSNYLLLLVVVWGVNSVLAERSGTSSSAIRLMLMGIAGVMGALTIALISLVSYLSWVSTSEDYLTMSYSGLAATSMAYYEFGIAYWTLFLLSVIAAGGLAIATILRMRSRNIHVGDILLWTIALFVCMVIWAVFQLIPFASLFDYRNTISSVTFTAMTYLNNFFTLFSYICLIFISKSKAWENMKVQAATYNIIGADAPAFVPGKELPQESYAYQGAGHAVPQGQPGNRYYDPPQHMSYGMPGPVTVNRNM